MSNATAAAVPAPQVPTREGMARRVGRNSLWLIGQPLALNALSIVSTGYITRTLGPGDYGTFNLALAQVGLFMPLCNLGLSAVAVRAIAQDRDNAGQVVRTIFAARLMLIGLGALLAVLWLLLPAYSVEVRLIGLAFVLSMVFQSCSSMYISLFQGLEQSRLAAQPQIAGGIMLTLLSVAALMAHLGLPGFVAAYILGTAVPLVLFVLLARRQPFAVRPEWSWTAIRRFLRQARPFAVINVVDRVAEASVLDVLILGLFAASGVGPYTAAMGLLVRLLIVPFGIADALYPAVASRYQAEREAVERTVRRYLLYLVLATLPLAVCLTFTAPTVLWILFGDQYLGATDTLRIAGWLLPLSGAVYLMRACLTAVHLQGAVVRLMIVSGGLLCALFAVLIPLFGALGAAVALAARQLVMLPFWSWWFARSFKQPFPLAELGRVGVALLAMTLPLGLLSLHYSHVAAVVAGLASFAVYGAMLICLGVVDADLLRLPGGKARAAA